MQHFTLKLYSQDDTHYHLTIQDAQQQNLIPSTTLDQSEIDILLKYAEEQYKVGSIGLAQQGERLFNWLDQHSNGWLRGQRQTIGAMALIIEVEYGGLRHLAWELLHDGDDFLCADPVHLFTPLRLASQIQYPVWKAEKRPLSLLFMASSPENIKPVLDFEQEEALIFNSTKGKAIQLQVEESGSLRGLQQRLEDRATTLDVLHLSGHADIKDDLPVFLLEDDIGEVVYSTAQQLAQTFVAADCKPRVLFLSGCRTAQSQQQQDILSFSEQMVTATTPVVLGWALPVADQAASQTAAFLYEKLAKGADIATAVAFARQQLYENGSDYWHLLRCSVANITLTPLVKKGHYPIHPAHIQQQFLDAGGQVPVCARTEFIGRRRLLQRSLRCLRSMYGDPAYADGLLLRGMGGLGKSSVAARLIERLSATHQPIVFYGGINETVVLQRIGESLPDVKNVLNDGDLDLAQRLAALFQHTDFNGETVLVTKPLLLVFDDFEQNIPKEKRQQAKAHYRPDSLHILHAIISAIRHTFSETRVIITSRFHVTVPAPCQLHVEALDSLRATDLQKKLNQLSALQTASKAHKQQAIKLAAGNPRLLEWLNDIFKESRINTDDLLAKLATKAEEFRENVLIEALVDAQESAVRYSLACAALYHIPVPIGVIEALTDHTHTQQHLDNAAKVGLVEIIPSQSETQYFISPLLDSALAGELNAEQQQNLQGKAGQALYTATEEGGRSEAITLEIVRLAVLAKDQQLAVKVGHMLAFNMMNQNRYRESEALCHTILSLGNDFKILRTLARAERRLGRKGFINRIKQAVVLVSQDKINLSNKLLKEKAITMGVFASILQEQGELDEALKIYQDEELPVYEKLGDVRSKAMTMGNIADILQLRDELDKALKIRKDEELPVYEQLDDMRSKAVTMGKIADILQSRGELDEALKIRQNEELPVYEKLDDVLGKAMTMGSIADILQSQGKLNEVLKVYQNEISPLYMGESQKYERNPYRIFRPIGIEFLTKFSLQRLNKDFYMELKIRQDEELPIYEKLGDMRLKAIVKGKIADILQLRGELQEALKIRQDEELPVYEHLGAVRELLIGRAKMAILLWQIDAQTHQQQIQSLLCLALSDAIRLRIPEVRAIKFILNWKRLNCEDVE